MTQTKTRSGLRSTISNAYKLYDGQTLLAQYVSPSGGTLLLASTNTTGADGLVSVFTGPASVFYTFDERGNVAQRTSSAGAVTSSDQYDAYGGQTTTSSGADRPVRFRGAGRVLYGCRDGACPLHPPLLRPCYRTLADP